MSGALQAVFQNQRSFVAAPGQDAYTSAGTYSWVAPSGITSVSVVAVGPQYYGEAGGLGWKNAISVTPANSYTVVVGTSYTTQNSYFISSATVAGNSGNTRTYVGDGGGNGGTAGVSWAGGGAGGYSGNGGDCGATNSNGGNGAGGAGGAGGSSNQNAAVYGAGDGGGGGGVGILGEGSSGTGGAGTTSAIGGGGGSGGQNGGNGNLVTGNSLPGGVYGGGRAYGYNSGGVAGGGGAVRIIWGPGRAFPSTNTGNV